MYLGRQASVKSFRIATIAGDGIGKEVVPEGIRVVDAAAKKAGITFEWDALPWSCEVFAATGKMMPDDGLAQIAHHDAIFLGAVGWPSVPDHVSLWGLLIPIRRTFRQYVNLRPVRLMPGIESPLANRKTGDIDFWIVRENNEGEYSSIGGRSTRAPTTSSSCKNRCSPGAASTGFYASHTSLRAAVRKNI